MERVADVLRRSEICVETFDGVAKSSKCYGNKALLLAHDVNRSRFPELYIMC